MKNSRVGEGRSQLLIFCLGTLVSKPTTTDGPSKIAGPSVPNLLK
jgi:hypothetical protein